MKLTITCTDFRKLQKNSLRGFATIHIGELKLTLYDIAVHQHTSGSRWVSLPARPMLDGGGVAKRTDDGRIEYVRLFSFDTRAISDAFSAATIAAVLERDRKTFDALPATGA